MTPRQFPSITTSPLAWLLAGDPAIRYQARRDLLDVAEDELAGERATMLADGWVARLLACQDPDGRWGGGLYGPKWISTTYTLLLLRDCGAPEGHPGITRGCRLLLDRGRYRDGGINFFPSMAQSEACVTGMVLSILIHFGVDAGEIAPLAEHLLGRQMVDGGWNCEDYRGATHGSFHTTVSVLESLVRFEQRFPTHALTPRCAAARAAGNEFLLVHRLFRSHRTGDVVDPRMTRLSFPPRWRYDILRALDCFRSDALPIDKRMSEALALLVRKRRPDGTWPLQQHHPGREFFRMEAVGGPSRWNTLRALRVGRHFGMAWAGDGVIRRGDARAHPDH